HHILLRFTSLTFSHICQSTHPFPVLITPLSLHDALPISLRIRDCRATIRRRAGRTVWSAHRPVMMMPSEEHTSELQSRFDIVCRLLLEKKKFIACSVI